MKIKCSFISRKNTSDHHHLYIPKRMMNQTLFQRHMTLRFGDSLLNVTCIETKADSLQIMLDTCDSLFSSIPNLENIWISIDSRRSLIHMGPVVALLINQFTLTGVHSHSLKGYFTECQNWFQRKGGFFYLLPLSSFIGNKSEGVAFDGQDWKLSQLPAPHVIYNRCHSRKAEGTPPYDKALTRTEEQEIHVFNSRFLSKDEVYDALKDSPVLSEHLPKSVKGLDSLEEMLTLYKDVFVKRINGSKGRYIMRIQKNDSDFLMHQNSFSDESPLTFHTFNALSVQIRSWCKRSSYLVQETIPFLTVEGCSLDFRFLCHLNQEEEWEIISSIARVSSKDQFVANVDQGGRIEKPLSVLNTLFSQKQSIAIANEMRQLCKSSAKLLSESIDGHFAEFGMDVGIDGEGKPWLIEVNSKPSKRTYLDNDRIRPSVKALYEYSFTKWTFKEE
ncbi:YheC/YheD family protein [Bacillus sp. BHET2]|uniref:YheC/YheD family endospore coat-associated protein n=1 Tax=Bacillus sp. BHET2 TaxID=2583818 RepID=UPI001486021B|nr:YheC/YheD family protein [Bacillus sp. BHET2]